MVWFNELKELAALVVPWLVGGGGAAIVINFLKEYLNIPDKKWLLGLNARAWLSIAVSFVVGLLVVLVEGGFDPENLTAVNTAETIALVWTSATMVYFKALGGRNSG
jgi:hypothetical protein